MTMIYFVRHGEYKNPDNIVPWRLPYFSLSEKGIEDIKRDAEYFKDKNIEVIYSSPVLRAKQSAKILAKKLNKEIIISSLISEVRTPLQNKHISYEEFNKKKTYPFLDDFHIKNKGESIDEIFLRVDKLVKKVLKKHKDKNIIFVSHGDPIMIYVLRKKGIIIDGSLEIFEKNNYIPKAEIIRVKMKSEKVINIKSINY